MTVYQYRMCPGNRREYFCVIPIIQIYTYIYIYYITHTSIGVVHAHLYMHIIKTERVANGGKGGKKKTYDYRSIIYANAPGRGGNKTVNEYPLNINLYRLIFYISYVWNIRSSFERIVKCYVVVRTESIFNMQLTRVPRHRRRCVSVKNFEWMAGCGIKNVYQILLFTCT